MCYFQWLTGPYFKNVPCKMRQEIRNKMRLQILESGRTFKRNFKNSLLMLGALEEAKQITSARKELDSCAASTQYFINIYKYCTFMLPCIVIDFFLNNQPNALIIQIYSVIKLYMFRASSLPIIRSFLLYIRHSLISCRFC